MKRKHSDWALLGLTVLLSLLGLLFIFDASALSAQKNFGDQFFYLKRQALWLTAGLAALIFIGKIDYHHLKKISLPFLLSAIVALILTLVPGLGIKKLGAQRWLSLGSFSFQPSELAKLAIIIYGASFFAGKENLSSSKNHPRSPWPFLAVILLIAFLIILQPDFGTAVIIVSLGLIILFLAETPAYQLLLIVGLGLLLALSLIVFSPYRQERLLTFLNPDRDPQGSSYHVHQILIALGSGGLWGQGLGKGRQKYLYLPEVATDSIFAVIAEELGFFGASFLIFLFAALIFRCLKIASQAKDNFGKLLAAGVGAALGVQTIVNLGAMVMIFPLTGIPLPLVSYGGSSLLVALAALGIVLSVSRERRKKK